MSGDDNILLLVNITYLLTVDDGPYYQRDAAVTANL